VRRFVTEKVNSVQRSEVADGAFVALVGIVIGFVMFSGLPAELADEIAFSAAIVRLIVNHDLFHTSILEEITQQSPVVVKLVDTWQ